MMLLSCFVSNLAVLLKKKSNKALYIHLGQFPSYLYFPHPLFLEKTSIVLLDPSLKKALCLPGYLGDKKCPREQLWNGLEATKKQVK